MTGADALLNTPRVRHVLAIISFLLLLFLAGMFALGAWRAARSQKKSFDDRDSRKGSRLTGRRGYLLGLTLALTSPWNLGFWLAVVGGQQSVTSNSSLGNSLALACPIILGAVVWTLVFSVVVKQGERIFARPSWQAATQAMTRCLMLFFAAKFVWSIS